jgi:hypothetical protein
MDHHGVLASGLAVGGAVPDLASRLHGVDTYNRLGRAIREISTAC